MSWVHREHTCRKPSLERELYQSTPVRAEPGDLWRCEKCRRIWGIRCSISSSARYWVLADRRIQKKYRDAPEVE